MATWITPITDRTSDDVDYAKNHPEATEDLKGAYNVSDHLRIENNISIVKNQIDLVSNAPAMTYTAPTIQTLGFASIFNTLALNIQKLRYALFPSLSSVPDYTELKTDYVGGVGKESINYETINTYEQNLLTLHTLAANQYEAAPFCNIFYCGEDYI